jgi:hypothetical protein
MFFSNLAQRKRILSEACGRKIGKFLLFYLLLASRFSLFITFTSTPELTENKNKFLKLHKVFGWRRSSWRENEGNLVIDNMQILSSFSCQSLSSNFNHEFYNKVFVSLGSGKKELKSFRNSPCSTSMPSFFNNSRSF